MNEPQEIPMIKPEEQPDEEYAITCTYPLKGRNIPQKPQSANYIKCDERKFYVKFNPRWQIATVICSKCHRQLFQYRLDSVEVKQDDSNRNANPSNSNDSANSDSDLGNKNDTITSQNS